MDAEIIEFKVNANCKITTGAINEMKFPKNANIAGVVRGDKGFIPFGDFRLVAGDRAVVFTQTQAIPKVERYFL